MNYTYPFSQLEDKGEVKQNYSGQGRAAISHATQLYQDAVTESLTLQHPRLDAFQTWLKSYPLNEAWYENNKDKIKLVDDGIEILGDVFCLDDETAEENGVDVWNHDGNSYFTFEAALRHAKDQGKRIPSDSDWSKYLLFLPGGNHNKFRFFTDVLNVKPAGGRSFHGSRFGKEGSYTYLWSSSPFSSTLAHGRYLNWDNPTVNRDCWYMGHGFSLRCLKTR